MAVDVACWRWMWLVGGRCQKQGAFWQWMLEISKNAQGFPDEQMLAGLAEPAELADVGSKAGRLARLAELASLARLAKPQKNNRRPMKKQWNTKKEARSLFGGGC